MLRRETLSEAAWDDADPLGFCTFPDKTAPRSRTEAKLL